MRTRPRSGRGHAISTREVNVHLSRMFQTFQTCEGLPDKDRSKRSSDFLANERIMPSWARTAPVGPLPQRCRDTTSTASAHDSTTRHDERRALNDAPTIHPHHRAMRRTWRRSVLLSDDHHRTHHTFGLGATGGALCALFTNTASEILHGGVGQSPRCDGWPSSWPCDAFI